MTHDDTLLPYVPHVFTILLSAYQIFILDGLLSKRLREHMKAQDYDLQLFPFVDSVARDRVLQIGYLSSIMSFLVSVVTAVRVSAPGWIFACLLIVFFLGLLSALHALLNEPGFLSSTKMKFTIGGRLWTYETAYTALLAMLNILLIGITYTAQQLASTPRA